MKGLLYKDFQLILNKFGRTQRILLLVVAILVTLSLKEAGTLFLAMILPLALSALPTSLLVADHESGWEQFVGVGALFGILYVAILLPFIYAFGTFGNTIVNIIFLALVMAGVYVLQKTSFGVTFISWLAKVNNILLITGSVLLLLIGTLISLKISIMVYARTFTDQGGSS